MNGKAFRAKLQSGVPQFGLCIMYPCPGELERIAPDWDWMWIDGQHGEISYADALAMVRACEVVGCPALVRAPSHDPGRIARVVAIAPTGVIVPLVDTPEEAHAVARAAESDIFLVAQIESPLAVENAEAIASVPGVDALFLGPDDIMLRRGHRMDAPRSKDSLGPDMAAVVAACRKHGKTAMASAGSTAEMIRHCIEVGFQMIVAGGDIRFLPEGSKQASKEARAIVGTR